MRIASPVEVVPSHEQRAWEAWSEVNPARPWPIGFLKAGDPPLPTYDYSSYAPAGGAARHPSTLEVAQARAMVIAASEGRNPLGVGPTGEETTVQRDVLVAAYGTEYVPAWKADWALWKIERAMQPSLIPDPQPGIDELLAAGRISPPTRAPIGVLLDETPTGITVSGGGGGARRGGQPRFRGSSPGAGVTPALINLIDTISGAVSSYKGWPTPQLHLQQLIAMRNSLMLEEGPKSLIASYTKDINEMIQIIKRMPF
jgi:hypothetical protein